MAVAKGPVGPVLAGPTIQLHCNYRGAASCVVGMVMHLVGVAMHLMGVTSCAWSSCPCDLLFCSLAWLLLLHSKNDLVKIT